VRTFCLLLLSLVSVSCRPRAAVPASTSAARPVAAAAPATRPAPSRVPEALGLGPLVTEQQLRTLEEQCRRVGFYGQACGPGYFSNVYNVVVPSLGTETIYLSFGHRRTGNGGLADFHGPRFFYRRSGDVFVREDSAQ
jgi:hypothetical protein